LLGGIDLNTVVWHGTIIYNGKTNTKIPRWVFMG